LSRWKGIRPMNDERAEDDFSTIQLAEEAIALLRRSPAGTIVAYYVGAVPFWLKLLFFLSDMSLYGMARDRLIGASFLLALLFLWMKCWGTVFASGLRALLGAEELRSWNARRVLRMVRSQAEVQLWGVFLRPLAYLTLLPAGVICAFFHHHSALGDGTAQTEPGPAKRAWALARIWPAQSHSLMGVLLLFSTFVWANVCLLMIAIPTLLKALTGWETMVTRSMGAYLNTTFLGISLALTLLCVGPVWSAAYVVRGFYAEALTTGADLRARLKFLRGAGLALLILLMVPAGSSAETAVPPTAPTVDVVTLDRSFEQVFEGREYAWRKPGEKVEHAKSEQGWARRFGDWLAEKLQGVGRAIKKFFKWIIERLFKNQRPRAHTGGGLSLPPVGALVWIGTAALAVALAVLGLRAWRRPRKKALEAEVLPATPDLEADEVFPDQLPEESWMDLARELMGKGELRLAIRAAYLAGLAHLGKAEYLTIARHKSNRDYQRELQRRARSREQVLAAFAENLGAFERAWYGRHHVTPEILEHFTENLGRIRAC